jgi:replicative DNA helicase
MKNDDLNLSAIDIKDDKEFRKMFLSLLTRDPAFRSKYFSVVERGLFSEGEEQDLFLLVKKLHFKSTGDLVPIIERYMKNSPLLLSIKKIDIKGIREFVDIEAPEYLVRKFFVLEAFNNMNSVSEGEFDPRDSLKRMQRIISIPEKIERKVIDYFDSLQERKKSDWSALGIPIRTFIRPLDAKIQGLCSGEYGTLLAGTNVGKTVFLCNIAKAALFQRKRVLYVTLEISKEEVANRIDAMVSSIPLRDLRDDPGKFAKRVKALKDYFKGSLKIAQYPSGQCTPLMIKSLIDDLMAEDWKTELLIIDYAREMKSDSKYRERREEIADIVRNLRALAGQYDFPCWSVSQLNRKGADSVVPRLTDISECWEETNIADVVICLSQPQEQAQKKTALLSLLKTRARMKFRGILEIKYNPDTLTMS